MIVADQLLDYRVGVELARTPFYLNQTVFFNRLLGVEYFSRTVACGDTFGLLAYAAPHVSVLENDIMFWNGTFINGKDRLGAAIEKLLGCGKKVTLVTDASRGCEAGFTRLRRDYPAHFYLLLVLALADPQVQGYAVQVQPTDQSRSVTACSQWFV